MNEEALSHTIFDTFEIDTSFLPTAKNENDFLAELRKILIRRIEELIDKNPERLLWILYRIDVSEQKVKQALTENASLDYSAVLADLIIQRQLEKIKTRYAEPSTADWSFDV